MGKGKLTLISDQQQQDKHIQKEIPQKKKIKKEKIKHKKQQQKHSLHQQPQFNGEVDSKYFNQEKQQKIPKHNQNKIEHESEQHQQSQQQNQQRLIKMKHLAIALPDSILQLPQTSQLRAYFIGEIARICSIFKDHGYVSKSQNFNPSEYMVRNLQYLETPQYLRKHLFKLHADLKNAGLMNPIESQHHLKSDQICEFREGVALDRPAKKGSGSWVDVGLKAQAKMDQLVLPLTRVTLRLKHYDDPDAPYYEAQAVSKKVPRIQNGMYWGYDVRMAKNMKDMFNAKKSSLNQEQYDIKLLCNHTKQAYSLPEIQHFYQISQQLENSSVLIFFSGTDDLQKFVEKDLRSKIKKQDAVSMFDCCMRFEGYGVKQLRIEEQMFITLSKICQYTY